MHRLHRAVAGALLLVTSAGCAGSVDHDPSADPPAATAVATLDPVVAAALDRVIASPTGRFSIEVTIDVGTDPSGVVGDTMPVSSIVRGAFDWPARRAAVWSGPGDHVDALLAADPTADPRMAAGSEVVVDGASIYVRSPIAAEALGTEGWTVDAGDDRDTVLALARAEGLVPDPAAWAELLRGAGPLTAEGDDVVRGVPATRHRTSVELDRVLPAVAEDRRELVGRELDELQDGFAQIGAPFGDHADALVWLDAEGDLVRFELELPMPAGLGDGASARVVLDLYDYGAPIVIEVPDLTHVPPAPAPGGSSTP